MHLKDLSYGQIRLLSTIEWNWNILMRGSKYHYKQAIMGPPTKRHINDVSLACRWWPNIECLLSNFVIFQGIGTSIAKKPYIFVIFQGVGPYTLAPPTLDPPMKYNVDSSNW